MATVETLELKIVDSSIKTVNGLNKLAATLQKLKNITTGNLGLNKVSNQMEKLNKALSGINEEYVRRLERIANALRSIKYTGKVKIPTYNQLKRATEPKKPKVEDAPQAPTGLQAFFERLRSFLGISNATKTSLNGIADAANKAGNSMKDASKRTYGFIDSAKFLLKYQLIFTIFSTLANALKEGIGNLYNWSKAMGGSFAQSLDTAKAKVTLLKNSVATALAPALTALIPVFNSVGNAIVFCLNAIAQLISALRGLGTWTKATDAVGDYTAAVKGAGAAQKGLLASFDELNVISSKSGGGGGGMANAWEGAFEEKELSPFFAWIKDHLSLVKTLALGIGAAVVGWKLSSGFVSAVNGVAGNFKKIVGFAMTISGAIMEASASIDAFSSKNSWDTLIGQLSGAALMAGGLFLMFGKVASGIGLIVGGIPMLVTGLKEWITTGEATNEVLSAISAGILFVAGGISLLTGNWLPLIVGGIGVALVWLVGKWDDIKTAISNAWNSFVSWMDSSVIQPVKAALEPIATWIKTYIITPIMNVVQPVIDLINKLIAWVSKKDTKVIEVKYSTSKTPSGASYTSTYTLPVSHGAGMAGMEMIDFQAKADGGFVNSGQLFVAREAGPELVGTIGGRTAVANNDQIIAGVASGVAAGQEEQNALLRKQNEILTRLLAKEFSAKVVPSAALGRVASQSEAMYRQMAGVNV